MTLRDELIARALAAGACAAGMAPAEPISANDVEAYRRWIGAGCHGTMDYLAKYDDVRADPRLLLDGARSVLCTAFSYYSPGQERSSLFADYALGEDYHTAVRQALSPVAEWMEQRVPGSATRICIDTAPLRERLMAVRAGLGFIGLNNQLITPVGSRVFLAEILWTAAVEPSAPCTDHCLRCGKCVDACPGRALDGCGGLDARRCLSYLTIEYRGDLPDDLHLSGRIYGCDICQDVCPHNARGGAEVIAPLRPRPAVLALDREAIAALTPELYASTFRRSAIKRVKLPHLLRNAAKK